MTLTLIFLLVIAYTAVEFYLRSKDMNRKAYMIKEALKGCLRYLSDGELDGKTVFVCGAICLWCSENPNKYRVEAWRLATEHIRLAISPCNTVSQWLDSKGVKYESREQLQQYRRAWVHHMIDQMSEWEKE